MDTSSVHMDSAQRLKCSVTCLAVSAVRHTSADNQNDSNNNNENSSNIAGANNNNNNNNNDKCITHTPRYVSLSRLVVCTLSLLLFCTHFAPAHSCGPGRGLGGRQRGRKLLPLVYKQHVPNMSEKTLGASGPNEGAIKRDSPRFKDLVPNYNKDIIFKDEEGTGADRLMTRRCKEKLNTLAVSVMNEWPGLRLLVIESWDEDNLHGYDSLHYEGRAVDITTSDRDRSKNGMLARLAVEAGFDWVYYASRRFIYCSVKSDSSTISHVHGCFTPESTVLTESGARKSMRDLIIGDRVLSMNGNGDAIYSEIILFMDRNLEQTENFVELVTDGGAVLTVTPAHLVTVWSVERQTSDYIFADRIEEGDFVLVHDKNAGQLRPRRVVKVGVVHSRGVVAPLTKEGTIVVNSVAASCYAVIDSQALAHWSLAPMRLWSTVKSWLPGKSQLRSARPNPNALREHYNATLTAATSAAPTSTAQLQNGIHWYAKTLNQFKDYVVPRSWRYQ